MSPLLQLCAEPPTQSEIWAAEFFRRSSGEWQSQRRYYTLSQGSIQTAISQVRVWFLGQGSAELIQLAELHRLLPDVMMRCGSKVVWRSIDAESGRLISDGETVMGVLGDRLYRDRGYATPKPLTAAYRFSNADIMQIETQYHGCTFEEELKLIGKDYRTRQTLVSRADRPQMIGQYLEQRLS